MDLIELFDRGGPLMWVILGASLVGTFVFVERLLALRRQNILPRDTYFSLLNHLDAGDFNRAEQVCRENEAMLCRIAAVGLKQRQQGRTITKEAMEETGGIEVGTLNAGIGVLSTVAAIAPLLGLLGTVTGMIQVFRDVAGVDKPDISLLAGGIWQALITTGAGLTIAIPFYVAYRYMESRIDRYGRELEEASLELLSRMANEAASTETDDAPSPETPAADDRSGTAA
jgi:biopolymer transport protein ExbB